MVRSLVWLGTTTACLTFFLVAQTALANDGALMLTQDGAIAAALAHNPGLVAAQQGVEVARAGRLGAGLLTNPDLSILADTVDREASIRQPIVLGNGLALQRNLADLAVIRAQYTAELAIATLSADVEIAYANLQLAQARQQLSREAETLGAMFGTIALKRFGAGDVARIEVLQAQTLQHRATSERAEADAQVMIASARLAALLGEPSGRVINATGPIESVDASFDIVAFPALSQRNPRLRLATLAVQEAENELALANSRRYPELAAIAGVRENTTDAPSPLLRLGVDIGLPIWKHPQSAVTMADAELARRRSEQVATEREIAGAVEAAALEAAQARARLLYATTIRAPEAQSLYDLARLGYQQGATSILAALAAQREWQQTRADVLDAAARYHVARAELDRLLPAHAAAEQERKITP